MNLVVPIFIVSAVGGPPPYMGTGVAERFPDGPVAYEDTQPSVEINLSPPRHPLPELSSFVSQLDMKRRMVEERQTTRLLKAFDEELARSRKLISVLIRKAFEAFDDPLLLSSAPSFFQLFDARNRPGKLWVSVDPPPPVDGAVLKATEILEQKNDKLESLVYHSTVEDLHEVTRLTLENLNQTLISTLHPLIRASFIAFSDANHRCNELRARFGDLIECDSNMNDTNTVTSNGSHQQLISVFAEHQLYPTVETLIRGMLDRREIDEKLFRVRSLALMARLAQEQSKIISELLQSAVSTILVVYRGLMHSLNISKGEFIHYYGKHPINEENPSSFASKQ